jgi:hypothetical protein
MPAVPEGNKTYPEAGPKKMQAAATNATTACCSPQNKPDIPTNLFGWQ